MGSADEDIREGERLLNEYDYKGALSRFDKAVKNAPNDPRGYFGKAEAAMGEQKASVDQILEWYRKAVELDKKNVFYITTLGSFCLEVGKFNEAVEFYNKATEIDEENAPLYFSEFAIGYYMRAPIIYEKFLDDKTMTMIKKKTLEYLLKAMDATPAQAKQLMDAK